MGDVKCLCGEPCEVYHLRHDAIYETEIPVEWIEENWKGTLRGLNPEDEKMVREAFLEAKYEFGADVTIQTRCQSCWDDPIQNHEDARNVLADILGDDIDGLDVFLEDFS